MSYYGLISGFPDLKPGQNLNLEISNLKAALNQYLTEDDLLITHHFFYQIDLINFNSIIQKKSIWLSGGNVPKDEMTKWIKTGNLEDTPFVLEASQDLNQNLNPTQILQQHWQIFYDVLKDISNARLSKFISFEISLKNFFKSHLERIANLEVGEHYIEGGDFDRFAYNKLLMGDIQAEHPQLAAALSCFDVKNSFDREIKLLESKWKYYDYISFFDAFGFLGVYSWLCKYLDLHKWQLNNKELGLKNMEAFSEKIINQTEEYYL